MRYEALASAILADCHQFMATMGERPKPELRIGTEGAVDFYTV